MKFFAQNQNFRKADVMHNFQYPYLKKSDQLLFFSKINTFHYNLFYYINSSKKGFTHK